LFVDEQKYARQKLPFLVQFWPLVIKYRKDLSLLQRVNPTIPHGGFTEYEKSDIYKYFPQKYSIPHIDILEETFPWTEILTNLLLERDIWFPCMLKANKGERGVWIYYVANQQQWEELMSLFTTKQLIWTPSTIQQYCDRPEEWCLQFYQHPQDGIRIWSLVKRNIPFVIWDGNKSVAELIYELPLSEIQQGKVINTLHQEEAELLEKIPEYNERINVVRKASIDFWTTYSDVTGQLTEQQQKKLLLLLADLLKDLPLLCAGRFDLKANTLSSLLDGEIRIIECNAWWGIPTHVYDESLCIEEKYIILDNHFGLMKEIALIHKAEGRFERSQHSVFLELIKASFTSLKKKWIISTTTSPSSQQVITLYKKLLRLIRNPHQVQAT
jgi:hypothetical protein